MRSRRHFLAITASSLTLVGAGRMFAPAASTAEEQPTPTAQPNATEPAETSLAWIPLALVPPPAPDPRTDPTPEPTPDPTPEPTPEPLPPYDASLLGPASGSLDSAYQWLVTRPNRPYVAYDIQMIVQTYQRLGDEAGVDWFLALAQVCHETDHLRSWWCQRPRRNPAGIGVTGYSVEGAPDAPPNGDAMRWAFRDGRWYEGVSFEKWDNNAVAAHLGRLLAYALAMPQTDYQSRMIDYALAFRPLGASSRGIAPTICGLNGRWAYPGTEYGQRIIALRDQMRGF